MKILKCPKCESLLDVYIGALRQMQAVSAEMLEKGIIYHCPSCHSRRFNVSDLVCPQCNEKKLGSSISEEVVPNQVQKKVEGSIYCLTCEFKIHVW
ncbi:MAG: hypothetical protein KAS63_10730 [Candidatus Heimdallarchaeota archaeon]|nr:hypothetical protein [Candidatus Heimdallarchaeota archaeon]MCK4955830.1 hypothetical protein [Candidatus Heimdallarchaeota archaeon]